MHIVQIATELAPVAKVGGLADVILGLSRELAGQGHTVEVILPKYDCLSQRAIHNLKVSLENLDTYFDGQWYHSRVWSGTVQDVKVHFIEGHTPHSFFSRGCIYGSGDDTARFTYFSRAALEFLSQTQRTPDILHLHDWHTALVAPLLHLLYGKASVSSAKTVFTIHNLDYQGVCSAGDLDRIGLAGLELMHSGKLSDNTFPARINLMKGAIVYSDFFNTVSPTYAQEIQKPALGRGMEATISQFKGKFQGILNGIDSKYWNPESDPMLSHHFSLKQLSKDNWTGKEAAKKDLRQRLNLALEQRPVIGCVARLVPQKGTDLIGHAILRTQQQGGQFILLGQSPDPDIQAAFEHLRAQNAGNRQVHFVLRTSEELAHQIFAGADMLLVPSLFEPCGLTQMIAMHHATVPIVRRTGGLADTVFDVDTSGLPEHDTNGFTFDDADFGGINWGIDRAIALWRDSPERWRHLALRGMQQDFSWAPPTTHYLNIYKSLCS